MTDRRPRFAAEGAWPSCCGRLAFVTFITLAMTGPSRGQVPPGDALRTRVRAYRTAHDTSIVRELRDFVAIPNVASDTANIRRNAERLRTMMESRGIAAKILESPTGGSPAVYGELSTPGATRTVVFYAHYDGQPVDTAQWTSPPWQSRPSRQVARSGRQAGGHTGDGGRDAGRVAALRPLVERRQGADRRDAHGHRCAQVRGRSALGEPQAVLRGRRGSGLRTPRIHPREECRPPSSRRLALRRRTGAPVAAPAGRVRRARRDRSRDNALRPVARASQRPLRELGAESGDDAGEPHRRHAE